MVRRNTLGVKPGRGVLASSVLVGDALATPLAFNTRGTSSTFEKRSWQCAAARQQLVNRNGSAGGPNRDWFGSDFCRIDRQELIALVDCKKEFPESRALARSKLSLVRRVWPYVIQLRSGPSNKRALLLPFSVPPGASKVLWYAPNKTAQNQFWLAIPLPPSRNYYSFYNRFANRVADIFLSAIFNFPRHGAARLAHQHPLLIPVPRLRGPRCRKH